MSIAQGLAPPLFAMRDDAGESAVCIVSAEYAKVRTPFDNGASNRHARFSTSANSI